MFSFDIGGTRVKAGYKNNQEDDLHLLQPKLTHDVFSSGEPERLLVEWMDEVMKDKAIPKSLSISFGLPVDLQSENLLLGLSFSKWGFEHLLFKERILQQIKMKGWDVDLKIMNDALANSMAIIEHHRTIEEMDYPYLCLGFGTGVAISVVERFEDLHLISLPESWEEGILVKTSQQSSLPMYSAVGMASVEVSDGEYTSRINDLIDQLLKIIKKELGCKIKSLFMLGGLARKIQTKNLIHQESLRIKVLSEDAIQQKFLLSGAMLYGSPSLSCIVRRTNLCVNFGAISIDFTDSPVRVFQYLGEDVDHRKFIIEGNTINFFQSQNSYVLETLSPNLHKFHLKDSSSIFLMQNGEQYEVIHSPLKEHTLISSKDLPSQTSSLAEDLLFDENKTYYLKVEKGYLVLPTSTHNIAVLL